MTTHRSEWEEFASSAGESKQSGLATNPSSSSLAAWDPFEIQSDNSGASDQESLQSEDDFEADEEWDESDSDNDGSGSAGGKLLNQFQNSCRVDEEGDTATTEEADDCSLVSKESVSSRTSITSRGFKWDKAKLVTMLSTKSLSVAPIDEQSSVVSSPEPTPTRRSKSYVDQKEVERLQKLSPEELARRFIQMQQTKALQKQQEALERSFRRKSKSGHVRRKSDKEKKSKKKSSRRTSVKPRSSVDGDQMTIASSHL